MYLPTTYHLSSARNASAVVAQDDQGKNSKRTDFDGRPAALSGWGDRRPYSQRWEIELGYWAIKQRLLGGEYTLRSKTPEMIDQELCGVLLGYNLLRYQMVLMSRQCSGVYPCEMSFTACSWAILGLLHGTSLNHPGNLPGFLRDLQPSAARYVLPHRRADRCFPRAVVGHAVETTHRRHLVRIETRTGPHVHLSRLSRDVALTAK